MIIPSRRKLGAAALIIAGIGAFLVPFLLHSPATQGTSNNNNNGSHTTTPNPTNPTPTTPTSPGTNNNDNGNGGGTTTGTCSDENSEANQDASSDLSVSHNAKDSGTSDSSKGVQGHAYGLVKNQLDTTVALVKSMGIHNSAFHSHHDTKTDNDTIKAQHAASESSNDHDSSCAEKEETNDD